LLPISGHNGHMGWSITANEPDINDVFIERFTDIDHRQYRYGTALLEAEQWPEEISVRRENGVENKTHTFLKTRHGPVFDLPDAQKAALRIAKLESGGVLEQFYNMSTAKNLSEFKSAIAPMNLTYNNIAYAGADGHIFYIYGGAIPKRNESFDWSQPVDGSNPETNWGEYFSIAELPQLQDPSSGYIQNSNSSPFKTTSNDNPDRAQFPSYMFRSESDTLIASRSRQLLDETANISFEQWSALAFDTLLPTAEAEIIALDTEWGNFRQNHPDDASALIEPITELKNWDRRADVESVATTLYVALFHTNSEHPTYPLLDRLQTSLNRLEQTYGTWRVPYGDINRLQRVTPNRPDSFSDENKSLPSPGLPFYMGGIFTFNTTTPDGSRKSYGNHGHSFVSVIEFSPRIQANSVMAFGQSRDPQSPHFFDQAMLYSQSEFKPAYFYANDIKQNSLRSYAPGQRK